MAKGENIFKRKDGRWEARYIKGYELSGKIKYGFCYGKTYREAKEKVTKCKAALVNGKPIPSTNSRHRFSFYCDEWLRMRKPKVKESTYIKYDTALRKHIKPKLGGCFPMGMTTGLIDDFTEELLFEDELAPKTVHDVLVVLHGILKYTATFFTGGFPAIEINYPKPGKKEMRVLSREEQTRFVSYLLDDMDTCKFGVLLTLFTGVRIGELCALQWGNISLKEQTIRIDATLQRLRDTSAAGSTRTRIVIGTPKSDTSIRTIPITDYTAELCGKMNPHSSAAYVLTGTPIFSIPYLGYVADYIQHPPGMYIAISAGAVLLLLVFIPDIFADDKDKDESKKKKSSRRKKGAHAAAHKAAAVDAAPEEPTGESLTDEIRRKTDNLLTDDEVEAIRQTVEAGRFDKAAADALRQELIKREAERDAQ